MAKEMDQRARQVIQFVPVEALRLAALRKNADAPGLTSMSGPDLRRFVVNAGVLSNKQICELFEEWRYGRGVSLTIAVFLKRPKNPGANFRARVGEAVSGQLDDEDATPAMRERALRVIGEDTFDDGHVVELPFKYGRVISYLDMAERPQSVTASRFGFAWVSAREQYVAVTGDQQVARRLLDAIAVALGSSPVRVSFDKTTLDKNFDLRSITSILQLDLERGIRTRVSGEDLWRNEGILDEIIQRDKGSQRLGAHYRQQVGDGDFVNLGVNAERSRINTTRALSSTDMREWVAPKLAAIARSLLELHKMDPVRFFQLTSGVPIGGVPRAHTDAVRLLSGAVSMCRKQGLTMLPIGSPATALAAQFPQKAGALTARVECAGCGDFVRAQCLDCLGHALEIGEDGLVRCADGHGTEIVCFQGHRLPSGGLPEAMTYEPERALFEWVSYGLADLGASVFDPTREHFWIHGSELLYQVRPLLPAGRYTVFVVDTEDSTTLQHQDREAYRELQRLLRNALMAVSKAHDGRFAQDSGDGGFTLFSGPKAAVAAARALQQELRTSEHNRRATAVRIGLATGDIETAGDRYGGDAIHLAARLQDCARTGTRIALDAATAYAIRPEPVRAVGKVGDLKGFKGSDAEYYVLER